MTAYQFKPGAHIRGNAQVIGERLEVIRSGASGLTPEAVVDDARPPSAVLHPLFEWDDAKAAESYRADQARHVIRSVVVTLDEATPQGDLPAVEAAPATVRVRAFLPVQRNDGAQIYESAARAMGDAEYRRQVLERAYFELRAVARKHRELKELAGVITAIDRVGEIISEQRLPAEM